MVKPDISIFTRNLPGPFRPIHVCVTKRPTAHKQSWLSFMLSRDLSCAISDGASTLSPPAELPATGWHIWLFLYNFEGPKDVFPRQDILARGKWILRLSVFCKYPESLIRSGSLFKLCRSWRACEALNSSLQLTADVISPGEANVSGVIRAALQRQ